MLNRQQTSQRKWPPQDEDDFFISKQGGVHSSGNISFYFPYAQEAVVFSPNIFLMEQDGTYFHTTKS